MNTVIFTEHDNVPVSSRQGRPLTGGLSVPRKSGPFDRLMVLSNVEGHTRNTDLTIVYHGGRCPDLSGPAGALCIGHETKKDISMLYSEFLSWITLKRSVGVIC